MHGEMKFDAYGFVVDADVEEVQSIRTHSHLLWMAGVALGRKHGGNGNRADSCMFASNCSSRGHTDQNHLRTGFPGSFEDLLDEARF